MLVPLLLALAAVLVGLAPARAEARMDVRIGIGDQNAEMFAHPDYQRMKIRQVRYFIPWNAMEDEHQRLRARRWVQTAMLSGHRPYLHVSTDDLRSGRGTLPTTVQYRSRVGRLVRYFRALGVRDFGAWNEVNHSSQPTHTSPWRAAHFFKIMRRSVFSGCGRSCRVVGLDVLDQRGVESYINRWMNHVGRGYASRYLRVVGIHNYSDVNRRRTTGLENIMAAVRRHTRRPNFWLTETGGVVQLGESWPCHHTRAANRIDFLFTTVARFRNDLQRVYLYNWTGGDCEIRFDAGLTNADGSLRRGYASMRRGLARFKR
jgi:hypothetical protein